MRVSSFVARQFRNLHDISVDFVPRLNVLIGENAQGKTNLIEGLFVLAALRSFRNAPTDKLISEGKEEGLIKANVENFVDKSEILQIKFSHNRRIASVNEKHVPPSQYVGRLKAVVFSPESLSAIKMGPEARRLLVDEAVVQAKPAAIAAQLDFSKALRQRNALLKAMKAGQTPLRSGREMLEALDVLYVELGAQVTFERKLFLEALQPLAETALRQILGDAEATMTFGYSSSEDNWLDATGYGEIRARILAAVGDEKRRQAEEALGASLTGPHRHDVQLLFNGKDSRIFASQGQQRALILGFKIAEIVYHGTSSGTYPILLLDDVLSELDERRRNYLIEFLKSHEAQTFITTTDLASARLLNEEESALFRVEKGKVTKA